MIQKSNLSQSTIINIMTNKKENVNNQINFNFLTNNVKRLQCSKKCIKCLNILKIKLVTGVFYFYKKRILRLTQKNNEMTSLRVNYISLTVKPIHVVFLLHFAVM